ncbi:hypothetical protein BDY19DRAFT_679824 [Irpex rosettiformis]|uniref:Uncharacterized protein n=1 Tax=Irpex rosettiformis TaxID=378272 RepID=A0ACB8UA01_9APHY|nr:hypothetical protein BDY19DRAFT_679824 [Irpex rosettiformis]
MPPNNSQCLTRSPIRSPSSTSPPTWRAVHITLRTHFPQGSSYPWMPQSPVHAPQRAGGRNHAAMQHTGRNSTDITGGSNTANSNIAQASTTDHIIPPRNLPPRHTETDSNMSMSATFSFTAQPPAILSRDVCEVCGKGPFGRLNELRRHRATVHKPPQYECDVCGNRFKRKDDRDRHNRSLHHAADLQSRH